MTSSGIPLYTVRAKSVTLQTVEETLFANRKTKEKMLQAINQNPFNGWYSEDIYMYDIVPTVVWGTLLWDVLPGEGEIESAAISALSANNKYDVR
jgi:hypothetical protein